MTFAMFAIGWLLYAGVIELVARGDDRTILLATLGIAVVLDNLALVVFTGDTRTIETPYSFDMTDLGPVMAPTAKLISFGFALLLAASLWLFMTRTDTGRAIRAVAREADGARLVGIRPARMFALAYGIGVACLGASACLLLPSFYVSPGVGQRVRAARLHHRGARGHGEFRGRRRGRAADRGDGVARRPLSGREFGARSACSLVFLAVLLLQVPPACSGRELNGAPCSAGRACRAVALIPFAAPLAVPGQRRPCSPPCRPRWGRPGTSPAGSAA